MLYNAFLAVHVIDFLFRLQRDVLLDRIGNLSEQDIFGPVEIFNAVFLSPILTSYTFQKQYVILV